MILWVVSRFGVFIFVSIRIYEIKIKRLSPRNRTTPKSPTPNSNSSIHTHIYLKSHSSRLLHGISEWWLAKIWRYDYCICVLLWFYARASYMSSVSCFWTLTGIGQFFIYSVSTLDSPKNQFNNNNNKQECKSHRHSNITSKITSCNWKINRIIFLFPFTQSAECSFFSLILIPCCVYNCVRVCFICCLFLCFIFFFGLIYISAVLILIRRRQARPTSDYIYEGIKKEMNF